MPKLPPLPEPALYTLHGRTLPKTNDLSLMDPLCVVTYSADQMHAYAEQARADLLARVEDLKADAGCLIKAARESHAAAESANKVIDELLPLALRYRWLRDIASASDVESMWHTTAPAALDAAIDAAIAAKGE